MRTFFSILLALIIFAVFGGLLFFFVELSSGAKFERKAKGGDKATEKAVTDPG